MSAAAAAAAASAVVSVVVSAAVHSCMRRCCCAVLSLVLSPPPALLSLVALCVPSCAFAREERRTGKGMTPRLLLSDCLSPTSCSTFFAGSAHTLTHTHMHIHTETRRKDQRRRWWWWWRRLRSSYTDSLLLSVRTSPLVHTSAHSHSHTHTHTQSVSLTQPVLGCFSFSAYDALLTHGLPLLALHRASL